MPVLLVDAIFFLLGCEVLFSSFLFLLFLAFFCYGRLLIDFQVTCHLKRRYILIVYLSFADVSGGLLEEITWLID